MPLRVRYQNDPNQECTIRPTPLVTLSPTVQKNGAGEAIGVNYSITLTGTLLDNLGSPYAYDARGNLFPVDRLVQPTLVGPYLAFDNNYSHFEKNRPPAQSVPPLEASQAIFFKQKVLRALFAQDGQRIEISDFNDDEETLICYPRVVDVSFTEGIYVQRCDYTITLECDTILDSDLYVDADGTLVVGDGIPKYGKYETELLNEFNAAYIQDYSEDWGLETDDVRSENLDVPRTYRISHNLSATGKTHYMPSGTEVVKLPAWEQAKNFVQQRLADSVTDYPNVMGQIGSGTVNLVNTYGGFNHVRTENIGLSDGTYSVNETWLLASGNAYEDYNSSISSSVGSPFVRVSVNGTVTGLSQINPSGQDKTFYVGPSGSGYYSSSAFSNALAKYNTISNNGSFGISSDIYKRCNSLVEVQLNSQPTSLSLGINEFNGEITYSLEFDNRPVNIISGVVAESISVSDTYPGDTFAEIGVLGRKTGPILQYTGSRTKYSRDVSLDLTMDYTNVPYGSGRSTLLLQKPSVVEPTATQIARLLKELSPQGEPGIRKYFVNAAPSETWNPKDGTYNFTISWSYELDK